MLRVAKTEFMVIGPNQRSFSDDQINIEIDAKLISKVKEAKSLGVIIDEQNEDRFSRSYITRTSICIHFIHVKYCSCWSIKNVKTVTSLNKQEVLIMAWLCVIFTCWAKRHLCKISFQQHSLLSKVTIHCPLSFL